MLLPRLLPAIRARLRTLAMPALLVLAGCALAPAQPAPPARAAVDARAGDVLRVRIGDLRPTQPAIGYDQVFYQLARKQPDPARYGMPAGASADDPAARYLHRTERKRVDDYCADNGLGGVAHYQPTRVRLIDPATYRCARDTPDARALKSVVVGPGGALYLTDGHHTLTTLRELADGGDALPVWVRVDANHADAADADAFWQRMRAERRVWLQNAQGQAISPGQLPARIALDAFQDDAYRSLVALTRGMGYATDGLPEFAEFAWGSWLRRQDVDLRRYDTASLDPARIVVRQGQAIARDSDSRTSYPAAVRDAALRMVAAAPDEIIADGRTARELGRLDAPRRAADWNGQLETEVWRPDTDAQGRYRTAGRAWYAAQYRRCRLAGTLQPSCWSPAR